MSSQTARAEDDARLRSMRLIDYGTLIIIKTDKSLRITEVLGDSERIFEVTSEQLLHDRNVWRRLLRKEDWSKLKQVVLAMGPNPMPISREIQIVRQRSKRTKWMLLHAVPLLSEDGHFSGWEGVGLDITEKREVEETLRRQTRRVEALYEVARSLHGQIDPAFVALRGLRALIGATNADSGFVAFYQQREQILEVVAAQGISQNDLELLVGELRKPEVVEEVLSAHQGLLANELSKRSEAIFRLAKQGGVESVIIVPLKVESEGGRSSTIGIMVLGAAPPCSLNNQDFELVLAASSQISLGARQAEYYAAERRHATSVAALYRLSHELSKVSSPADVAQLACPVIQEELECKRIWLGVINEQGTHIIGQGGLGPGMRREGILDIELELGRRHDFLDKAIRTREAVIVYPGQEMECSELNSILKRLAPQGMVLVPLVSLGQVIGVVVVEPTLPLTIFVQERLPLLSSMASEMATVMLARKFENKMADAEKMRMAGVLASGVAHNFNNLLQAIMGQASLIEMQTSAESIPHTAACNIVESAGKGARIVKQMMALTERSALAMRDFSVNEMLSNSVDLYRSLLGSTIEFSLNIDETAPAVFADYGQVQQVITNLVMNSMEAIGKDGGGKVSISTKNVEQVTGELVAELPPGDYLKISVEDNGKGMSEETLSRCFEPFFTTKNVDSTTGIGFEATGLGLSLSYSVMKQHGGGITVRSVPGSGTVFSVYLPAAGDSSEKTAAASHKVISERAESALMLEKRAFLFFGEREVPLSVRSTLESFGFAAQTLSDIAQLREVTARSEGIDVLVIDMDQAQDPLSEELRRLVQRNPRIRILALSVDAEAWKEEFSMLKAITVVEKPIGVWLMHVFMRDSANDLGQNTAGERVELVRAGNERNVSRSIPSGVSLGMPDANDSDENGEDK